MVTLGKHLLAQMLNFLNPSNLAKSADEKLRDVLPEKILPLQSGHQKYRL